MTNIHHRYGRFEIAMKCIEDIENNQASIKKIFGEVFILRAETLLHKSVIEYYGVSKHFDEIEEGTEIPTYTPTFTTHTNKRNKKIIDKVEWVNLDKAKVIE